jgi:hypothetical protein
MDDDQRFLLDLQGYLVIPSLLSRGQLAAANAAVDLQFASTPPVRRGSSDPSAGGLLSEESPGLVGEEGRAEFYGFLGWPAPHCDVFRELMVQPTVLAIMLELLDDGFRLDHMYGIWMTEGTEGHYMHAIENAAASYRVDASGAIRCGMCVCSFQLTDQLAGDGGFVSAAALFLAFAHV